MVSKTNIGLIYCFSFLTDCLFLVPILLPFYKDHIGLGYKDLMLGESALAASCIFFDVPTGWLADKWTRKYILILGALAEAAGMGVLLIAHALWQILAAQTLSGIGICLINGTLTALLYDTLLSLKREEDYRKLEGRRQAATLYAGALCSAIGGSLYAHSNFLPFYLSIAAQAFAICTALAIAEPDRAHSLSENRSLAQIFRSVTELVRSNPRTWRLMVCSALLLGVARVVLWIQQPYYTKLHFSAAMFGLLIGIGSLIGGASSQLAYRLQHKMSAPRILALCWGTCVLVCAGAALLFGSVGVGLLMLGGSGLVGTLTPPLNSALNRAVGSEHRATVLSSQSFLNYLFFIPMSATIGWLVDTRSVKIGLLSLAAFLCVTAMGGFGLIAGTKKNWP